MLGRLQFWLQGHPDKQRPWVAITAGNLLSDARYWAWRARGGTIDVPLVENGSGTGLSDGL